MVYPIILARSENTRSWDSWDSDGNEYIDFTMGNGSCIFGHSPEWLTTAIGQSLRSGTETGPQSQIAGKLAKAICELTAMERATFFNNEAEAMMIAIKLARNVTRRERIASFTAGHHGAVGLSLLPGDDCMVLDYKDAAALEILIAHAPELAAVVVKPGPQPHEFLQTVRETTASSGTALILDEAATGFRCAPGDTQANFGIHADMATYSNVIAGGMPLGILAGRKNHMDALDGGDERSSKAMTHFPTGIFRSHPLALAAAMRVVEHLMEEGPRLQIEMQERVAKVCRTLNEYLEKIGIAIRLSHFSSDAVIECAGELKYSSLPWFFPRA